MTPPSKIVEGRLRVAVRIDGWGGVALALVLATGCSSSHFRKSADKEVYATIAQKTPLVPNMDPDYSLESAPAIDLGPFALNESEAEFFGEFKDVEVGARVLNLTNVLALAVEHNRQYQNEKESLYLQALGLTLTRHRYTPLFTASGGVSYDDRSVVEAGVDEMTREHQVQINANAGASMLLRTGGRIATGFTTDFLRYLVGDRTLPTSSACFCSICF